MRHVIFSIVLGLLLCTNVNAQKVEPIWFESWSAGVSNDGGAAYAGTVNDSGAVFGQWCYKSVQGCYWILASDSTCEAGVDYPSLMNSSAGSNVAMLRCTSISGTNRMVFKDFSMIDNAVKATGVLAIATPMQNGSFKVQRFDLKGVQQSITAMQRIYETMVNGKTGTKDLSL